MRFIPATILLLVVLLVVIYLFYLIIKALRKYTKSEAVRKEKAATAKTLGEVLKQRRVDCKMTQEFVAETIGVSRQAVSKWESGAADPSTTNLMALAKLFGLSPEELIKETKEQLEA
jgi:DNA-binding XRE family transcriptional regulator